MSKQFILLGDTYWFYPCSKHEIEELLEDEKIPATEKNINRVAEGIAEFIQDYEYENSSIDSSVVRDLNVS